MENANEIFGPRTKSISELEQEIVNLRNRLQVLYLTGGELCLAASRMLEISDEVWYTNHKIEAEKLGHPVLTLSQIEDKISENHQYLQESIFYMQRAMK
jgi:hypothetical protein